MVCVSTKLRNMGSDLIWYVFGSKWSVLACNLGKIGLCWSVLKTFWSEKHTDYTVTHFALQCSFIMQLENISLLCLQYTLTYAICTKTALDLYDLH